MDLLLVLMFIIGLIFAIIIGIASLFQDDQEIVKRFMENKPLSCTVSTPFVKPVVITKREWHYDADLNVFYHSGGRNFEPSDCDNWSPPFWRRN